MSMKDIIDMSRQQRVFHRSVAIAQPVHAGCQLCETNIDAFLRLEKSGLKTGMYYLRTKAAVDAIKFTLNNEKKAEPLAVEAIAAQEVAEEAMSVDDFKAMIERSKNAEPDDCEMCGS